MHNHSLNLFCLPSYSLEGGILFAMFIAGLIGGFSHCSMMCSPFTFALSVKKLSFDKSSKEFSEIKRFYNSLLLSYHFGRILTYSLIGGIVGWVSVSVISEQYFEIARVIILSLAIIIMIISAFNIFSIQRLFSFNKFTNFIDKISSKILSKETHNNSFIFGVLMGFLPCAFLYAAFIASASSGDFITGALSLFAFGVGTFIPLTLSNYGIGFFVKKFRTDIKKYSPYLMFVNCVFLIFIIMNHFEK
ncbi:MAG: sulfite exporter TauE/SafE family protein [Rickettsiales bacterium]|nr:sulfite exporter TauE/SafE family protein [Rickettsiales bacterium]